MRESTQTPWRLLRQIALEGPPAPPKKKPDEEEGEPEPEPPGGGSSVNPPVPMG